MKILCYNTYGIYNGIKGSPSWEERQKKVINIIRDISNTEDIDVICLQEVFKNQNKELIKIFLESLGYKITKLYPMSRKSQIDKEKNPIFNIIAVKKDIEVVGELCIPHGSEDELIFEEDLLKQKIDENMSEYRSSSIILFRKNNENFVVGNTHTDFKDTESKINGIIKTLDVMKSLQGSFSKKQALVGDMNMISHMAEVHRILEKANSYIVFSRSSDFDVSDQSYHGYNQQEQVHVDYAFIPNEIVFLCNYKLIKQKNIEDEGSDHRPFILTIEEEMKNKQEKENE